jgi:3-oxoacyl-[acyl-carrier-protein] synthase II
VNGPDNVTIAAWSTVSPFGIGREPFTNAVNAGRSAVAVLDRARWQVPDECACLVPGFDLRGILGNKGTRAMNRVTGLAVTTVGQLIEDADAGHAWGEDTALVLGTTTGSSQSNMDITRSSLTGERPFDVEPARLPYCVMNCAAGQCAIWYGLKGPNATIAAGRPTSLTVLSYARRLLLTGRAVRVLCGAAEEYSAARSWIDFHSRGGGGAVLGEGCVMFVVELASLATARPLASVLAMDSRVCVDGDWRSAVGRCVQRVLTVGGCLPQDIWAVCPSGADDEAGRVERETLAKVFGTDLLTWDVAELIGETHAASAAFQIARVLSAAEHSPEVDGRLAVVTSTDPSGAVGAALLRLGDSR